MLKPSRLGCREGQSRSGTGSCPFGHFGAADGDGAAAYERHRAALISYLIR